MLSYWSHPYPDEILYSIIARHISYFGNGGPKQLLPDLFGRDTISSTIDLPSGLASLAKRTTDHSLGVTELIYEHTLFPYYGKFMTEERKAEVIESMQDKSGNVHTRCGINAGPFPSIKMPRFCPECCKEDLVNYNETYFRRAHQIPSLKICTTHNIFLRKLKSNAESINKHFFAKPRLLEVKKLLVAKPNHNIAILEIGKKVVRLLTENSDHHFENKPLFYNESLKQLGFRKGKNSLQIEEIYQAFEDFYDYEMLVHYKSSVDVLNQSCWLKAIFRKHRKSFDPIRHILVLNFIKKLKSKRQEKHLIERKTEQYVCRNPICKQYNTSKNTQYHIQTDAKSKREITYIKCGCGYCYTKSFIKSSNSWFIRVKKFGALWETELLRLIKLGKSIRSIATTLQVDSKTIRNNFNRAEKKSSNIIVVIKQKEWILLKRKFPEHSITDLRIVKPSIYSLLYRHAKDWLFNQNYPSKSRTVSTRVDWKERDIKLLNLASNGNDRLKTDWPKRRRSTSALLNFIGKESMFRVNKEKLPKLVTYLQENSESPRQFRLRRLALAVIDLRTKRETISYWKLLRAAGIRKEYLNNSIHEIVLKVINGSINKRIQIDKSA